MKKIKYKKYRSKIGIFVPLIYLVIVGVYLLIWLLPNKYLGMEINITGRIVSSCCFGLLAICLIWATFSTYYVITPTSVVCVFGPLKTRVALKNIVEVKEGISFFSAPALSCKRIYLQTGKTVFKRTEVSPKEKEEFLEQLNNAILTAKEN